MEKKLNVAAATKSETANAATSAAKTATPSTAAGVKPAAEKPEAPKAEAKPAAPAATPAPTKTAAPAKTETPKAETKTEQPAAPAPAAEPKPAAPAAQEDENAAKVAAFAAALNDKRETIEEMQKRLNEELQRLNHKKEVADKRNVYLTCSGKMDEYLKLLREEGEFETNLCRLSFEIFEKDSYGRENFKDFMTVTNTAIVTKFCSVLKEEIAAKVAELETELLKA